MPLYRLKPNGLEAVPETSFADEGLKERNDLQRLLRDQPDVIEEGLFIVAEEYGNWEQSNRRIDLLALDRDGRLVVIELKRTEDGGYMDLQAIRYAAMVSNMTFDQVTEAHHQYLSRRGINEDARQRLLDFLQPESDADADIDSHQPRILLVSGGFSRELTTSVLWLNDAGLDIGCIRLRPYTVEGNLVLDVARVVPLPEAEDYMIRVRKKAAEEAAERTAEKRERTIHILERAGIVTPGTRLVICVPNLPDGASVDLDDLRYRATIGERPSARNNVIWDFDQQSYSLSNLTRVLQSEHDLPVAPGVNGYIYWALDEKPDKSLWQLGEETREP